MPKPAILAGLGAFALLALTGAAAAQGCSGETDRLARQYNLATDTLTTAAGETPGATSAPADSAGATMAERAARSAGVTAPPDTGTTGAVQPAPSAGDTVPPPEPGAGTGAGLTAAERKQMESLLQAARAAERQGKPAQCLERLREAAAVPGPAGTK